MTDTNADSEKPKGPDKASRTDPTAAPQRDKRMACCGPGAMASSRLSRNCRRGAAPRGDLHDEGRARDRLLPGLLP